MRSLKKFVLIVTICLAVLSSSFSNASAKEAFDILSHTINVVVNENGELDITETMSVHFNQRRHGIYVNIPEDYKMQWTNHGQTISKSYFFPIKDMEVLSGHEFSADKEDKVATFKIGSSSEYANEYETYVFKYTIITKDLDMDGLEMVFLNLRTNGWDTTTDKCNFSIKFPKNINVNNIYFASPEGEFKGIGSFGSLTIDYANNIIAGSYNKTLGANDSLTIQVVLPEGYFQFANLKEFAGIGMVASGIVAAIMTVLFVLFGRDDQVIVTAEYHTPANLDSAQVGVIVNETVNDRDIMSLLLDWGRRGIITIEETKDDLILNALTELPNDALNYEKTLYEGLFKEKKSVALSELRTKFYVTFNKAKKQLEKYFKGTVREISTKSSRAVTILGIAISWLPITLASVFIHLNYYWSYTWIFVVLVDGFLLACAGAIAIEYGMNIYVSNSTEKTGSIIVLVLFVLGPAIYLAYLCTLVKANVFYYLAILLMQVIVLVEIAYMHKRTIYGNSMLGRVLGLKEFIENANEETLQTQLENNPYYFYDILPFAYALGLTTIWNEHFKNLTVEPCEWYMPYGTGYSDNYHRMHSLDSHMHSMTSSMTSVPASESGGSSSGGGFSGGGGFGGSSGGSW